MQKLGVCFGILSRITAAHCNQRIHNTNINFFPLSLPPFPLSLVLWLSIQTLVHARVAFSIRGYIARITYISLFCIELYLLLRITHISLFCIVLYLLSYGLHIFICVVLYCIYHYTDYTYLEQIDKEPPPFHWTGHGRYQRNCDFISACHQLYPVRRPDLRGDVRKALEKSVGSWI